MIYAIIGYLAIGLFLAIGAWHLIDDETKGDSLTTLYLFIGTIALFWPVFLVTTITLVIWGVIVDAEISK